MKNLVLATFILLPMLTIASEGEKVESQKVTIKHDEHKKYCYYEGKKFSEGARHFQGDEWKVCIRGDDGALSWKRIVF